VIAGYPVTAVKAVVFDGKMHPVDSKDIAFQTAGRGAFKDAFKEAGPVLLEPIMIVRVTVPEENMGDIMGDMNTRRGRVMGMETEVGHSIVTAEVPLAEVQRYSNDLRSMTAGRGVFTMEFARLRARARQHPGRDHRESRKEGRRRGLKQAVKPSAFSLQLCRGGFRHSPRLFSVFRMGVFQIRGRIVSGRGDAMHFYF